MPVRPPNAPTGSPPPIIFPRVVMSGITSNLSCAPPGPMRKLFEGLEKIADDTGMAMAVNHIGSLGSAFFRNGPVRNFEQAQLSDTEKFAVFHRKMLSRGVYLAPSQFETIFLGTSHTDDDVAMILAAAEESLSEISGSCTTM